MAVVRLSRAARPRLCSPSGHSQTTASRRRARTCSWPMGTRGRSTFRPPPLLIGLPEAAKIAFTRPRQSCPRIRQSCWNHPEPSLDDRLGATGRADPPRASVDRNLEMPHDEANRGVGMPSHCSRTPFACHGDHQRWERAESNQGRSFAHRPYPRISTTGQGTA